MKYSFRFFIYSIISAAVGIFLHLHPIAKLNYIIYVSSVSITLNKLFILLSIFFCIEFAIIGLIVKSRENRSNQY